MKNKQGFTLVELMIAMVIILVAILGMYKTVLISIEGNMKNVMRDEGRQVAERVVNDIRGMAFDEIPLQAGPIGWLNDVLVAKLGMDKYDDPHDGSGVLVPRIVVKSRNAEKMYRVVVIVTDENPFKELRVVVGWNVKQTLDKAPTDEHPTGKEFEHSITTMVSPT